MSNLVEELMGSSLGSLLSTEDAKHLVDKGKSKTIPQGSCLFMAGTPGDALFVILSGTMEVILGQAPHTTVVATVGAGQVVGELEVMTKSNRVATLSATTEATVLELAGASLDAMLAQNHPAGAKIMTYIAKTLARRLAAVNQRIVSKPRVAAPAAAPAAPAGAAPAAAAVAAKAAPAPPAAAPADTGEPMELDDADVVAIDEDDLDVLDKLWG